MKNLGKITLLLFAWPMLMAADCTSTEACPDGFAFRSDDSDECIPGVCFAAPKPEGCAAPGESFCDCPSERPQCTTGYECVACLDTSHCTGDKPFCTTTGSCVECEVDGQCGGQYCEKNTCVECRNNDDCDGMCDDGICVNRCNSDADCAGNPAGSVCNPATNACVGCLPNADDPDAEEVHCPGTSCNPKTLACTSTPKRSVGNCQSCVADRDCEDDHRCVELNYMGEARGGYCLRVEDGNCQSPTEIRLRDQVSTSGKEADFCGFNQTLATCEALLKVGKSCGDGCPESGMCINMGSPKCTVSCNNNANCPKDYECSASNICEIEAS